MDELCDRINKFFEEIDKRNYSDIEVSMKNYENQKITGKHQNTITKNFKKQKKLNRSWQLILNLSVECLYIHKPL